MRKRDLVVDPGDCGFEFYQRMHLLNCPQSIFGAIAGFKEILFERDKKKFKKV